MKKVQIFNSERVNLGQKVPELLEYDYSSIEQETMVHQASVEFTKQHGGPITQCVLSVLEKHLSPYHFENLRIDTKVHMLNKGWLPSVGGWHCDFVHRVDGNIQPNSERDNEVMNWLIISGHPETEFIYKRDLKISDETVHWKDISQNIDSIIDDEIIYSIPAGTFIRFCGNELHRAVQSSLDGFHWRYLFRATFFPPIPPAFKEN